MRTAKLDPVVRVEFAGGRVVFLKDAGDTVEAGGVGNQACPKPAARIGVERRAIRRLGTVAGVELPEVVWFDKELRTLVLSEACPSGTTLQSDLDRGEFDPHSAEATGIALSALHSLEISPLWGNADADVAHWRRMLAVKTHGFDDAIQPDLDRLYVSASRLAANQAVDCLEMQQQNRGEQTQSARHSGAGDCRAS